MEQPERPWGLLPKDNTHGVGSLTPILFMIETPLIIIMSSLLYMQLIIHSATPKNPLFGNQGSDFSGQGVIVQSNNEGICYPHTQIATNLDKFVSKGTYTP